MKRMLCIAGATLLGAVVYVSDPPTLPALEMAADAATVEGSRNQSMVVRLAEAGMVWRREQPVVLGEDTPDPEPEKLFRGKK